jgi:hypothetical protein
MLLLVFSTLLFVDSFYVSFTPNGNFRRPGVVRALGVTVSPGPRYPLKGP